MGGCLSGPPDRVSIVIRRFQIPDSDVEKIFTLFLKLSERSKSKRHLGDLNEEVKSVKKGSSSSLRFQTDETVRVSDCRGAFGLLPSLFVDRLWSLLPRDNESLFTFGEFLEFVSVVSLMDRPSLIAFGFSAFPRNATNEIDFKDFESALETLHLQYKYLINPLECIESAKVTATSVGRRTLDSIPSNVFHLLCQSYTPLLTILNEIQLTFHNKTAGPKNWETLRRKLMTNNKFVIEEIHEAVADKKNAMAAAKAKKGSDVSGDANKFNNEVKEQKGDAPPMLRRSSTMGRLNTRDEQSPSPVGGSSVGGPTPVSLDKKPLKSALKRKTSLQLDGPPLLPSSFVPLQSNIAANQVAPSPQPTLPTTTSSPSINVTGGLPDANAPVAGQDRGSLPSTNSRNNNPRRSLLRAKSLASLGNLGGTVLQPLNSMSINEFSTNNRHPTSNSISVGSSGGTGKSLTLPPSPHNQSQQGQQLHITPSSSFAPLKPESAGAAVVRKYSESRSETSGSVPSPTNKSGTTNGAANSMALAKPMISRDNDDPESSAHSHRSRNSKSRREKEKEIDREQKEKEKTAASPSHSQSSPHDARASITNTATPPTSTPNSRRTYSVASLPLTSEGLITDQSRRKMSLKSASTKKSSTTATGSAQDGVGATQTKGLKERAESYKEKDRDRRQREREREPNSGHSTPSSSRRSSRTEKDREKERERRKSRTSIVDMQTQQTQQLAALLNHYVSSPFIPAQQAVAPMYPVQMSPYPPQPAVVTGGYLPPRATPFASAAMAQFGVSPPMVVSGMPAYMPMQPSPYRQY